MLAPPSTGNPRHALSTASVHEPIALMVKNSNKVFAI